MSRNPTRKRSEYKKIFEISPKGHCNLFEISPEAIVILDVKGNILNINGRVYDWLGYKPKEVIGKNILELSLLTKESKAKVKEKFTQRILGKEVPPYKLDFITKAGERAVGRVVGATIEGKDRKIIGALIMICNITEEDVAKGALRSSEQKFKDLIETTTDWIWETDKDGVYIYSSPKVKDLLGYEVKDVLGKTPFDFMPEEEAKRVAEIFKEIVGRKKSFYGLENINRHKKGHLVVLETNGIPIFDEKKQLKGYRGIDRDITERKEVERAKNEFISLASHQLRTPLTTISWYAEVLLAEKVGKVSPKQKEYIEEIYQTNQKMTTLVKDLLNASRIELGTLKIQPEPTSLVKLADDILRELTPQIRTKSLKIKKNYDKNLLCPNTDPELIRMVFQNIIDNSVKYTPSKGKITIEILQRKADILVKIADTGYGIPKGQHDKIFTKLFRADNVRQKEPEGTGLGLYIVKSFVEKFGGKIWFESEETKGSTFYFTAPLSLKKKIE